MIGVYRIVEGRVNEMKGAGRFMVVKMFLAIYGLFIVATLLRKDEDKLALFVLLTATFAVIIITFLIISFFTKSPIYNTVIEITEQGLVRSGQELLTVRIKFDEIDKMIAKDNGTILLKKGLNSRVGLYFNKQSYINEFDILFIPLAIDNYDNILRHIKHKIK